MNNSINTPKPRSGQQAFEYFLSHTKSESKKNSGDKQQGTLESMKKHVIFERLIHRLATSESIDYQWAVKGGSLMNLRFPLTSRATKDIDISVWGMDKDLSYHEVRESLNNDLRSSESVDDDFISFKVLPQKKDSLVKRTHGTKTASFHIEAWMGKKLATSFHMDIGIDDIPFSIEPYKHKTSYSEFMDYSESEFPAVTIEQHMAEKIHAYTMPREGFDNMRYKDLYDLVILIDAVDDLSLEYNKAMEHVFTLRNTHDMESFNQPPENWKEPFEKLTEGSNLNINIENAYEYVRSFVEDGIKMNLDDMLMNKDSISI